MRYALETDDEVEHLTAVRGWLFRRVLRDLDGEFREAVKYGDDEVAGAYAQKWRDALHRILDEHDLRLED